MDGTTWRTTWLRRGCLGVGLLVWVSGCKTAKPTPGEPAPYQVPVADSGNAVSKFFQGNTQQAAHFAPQPPAAPVVTRDPKRLNKGLGADGEVGLAIARFDAASMKATNIERDQMLDASRQGFERALKADPKNREAHIGLARLYTHIGDKANAIAMLKNATKHYPTDHELHHRLAAVYFHFREPSAALQATQNALRHDPQNRVYLKTLALCQAHLDDWQSAFGTLVGRNVMTEAEARYFLGRTLMDLGRLDEGQSQIQMAAEMDPNYTVPRQFLQDLANGGPKAQEPVHLVGYESTDPPLVK